MEDIQFILLDMSQAIVSEWNLAYIEHVQQPVREKVKIVHSKLGDLSDEDALFDCIVSPANSYARLDGSFDHFLAKTLASGDSEKEYYIPTKIAQAVLYRKWKGYAPPGSCTLVDLTDTACKDNKHKCKFIAICPTMRIPDEVNWDREVVYNVTWSLLNALWEYNQSATEEKKIKKVLMPGMATGVGEVSPKKCAQQMALAFKDFYDACQNQEEWGALEWGEIFELAETTRVTHDL